MILLLPFILLPSAASYSCGQTPIAPREEVQNIVGGTIAKPYSWPWQVELCTKSYGSKECDLYCGGSLIDSEWVMTAAHCVKGYVTNPGHFGIKLGLFDYRKDNETGEVLRDVARIHIHPKYKKPLGNSNDIALIRLSSPVNFTNHIQPICVARNVQKLLSYKKSAFVTGWGAISSWGSVSNELRQVEVPFLSEEECMKEYVDKIDGTMICFGKEGLDSCQGDSGGPLVMKHARSKVWFQVGVVSWGRGCGAPGYAGVYSRASTNFDFIEQHTRKQICVDIQKY